MLFNFFKTALRNLWKQKGYSLINILGLAIGMACSLLILLYVQDELSYDRYSASADRTYRINMFFRMGGREGNTAVAAPPLAKILRDELPEVLETVRFRDRGSFIVRYEDTSLKEQDIVFTDPSFFSVFSIPLLEGDPAHALANPNSLVMSRAMAKKYFGEDDPIGKTLRLDNSNDLTVTGVFDKIPHNTHFHFDILVSLESLEESRDVSWLSQNFQTYVVLAEGVDPKTLEPKLDDLIIKYMGPQIQAALGQNLKDLMEEGEMGLSMSLQPLTSIHLHSNLQAELQPNSDIKYVYIFSAIALFILIIAAINFMNLSTARASGRAKEVGIRKVLGSHRRNLIKQFLTESMLLSLVSVCLGIIFVRLVLNSFNQLSGKSLFFSDLLTLPMILAVIGVTLLTGLLAGSYPALMISAFQPVQVLKGKARVGIKSGPLRQVLVVFQFASSIILIIGTIVVYNQLHFVQTKKLGYEKEQVLILEDTYLLGDQQTTFKKEMLMYPQIVNASVSGYLPVPSNRNNTTVFPAGNFNHPGTTSIQVWQVDYDYIKTLGMNIVEGRDFSEEYGTDNLAAVINEQAVKQYGFDNPLNEKLSVFTSNQGDTKDLAIVGVVEDFHFDSLRSNIQPLLMMIDENGRGGRISLRFKTDDVSGTIALLRDKWKSFAPFQPFSYSFMDDRFYAVYEEEQRIGTIFGIFAGLAILIGCLGLFGLASFIAEKRTKEIGIRKVLGASVSGVVRLLMREFVLLVGVANLVAWPVAYLIMSGWLKDFAYRTNIPVWIFVLAGGMTLLIAMLTVTFQSVRAAHSDPIRSLRHE